MKPSKSKPPGTEDKSTDTELQAVFYNINKILDRLSNIEDKLTPKKEWDPRETPGMTGKFHVVDPYRYSNPWDPITPSSSDNHYHQHHDQDESSTPLSQDNETRQNRGSYCHVPGDHYKPGTSHCKTCGSSPNTSGRVRIAFHQTSTLRESYAQLLSQTLSSILAQHGSSNLTDELFQVLSCLLSTPELECHVEQQQGRIHIQFLCDNHLKFAHSEITLHQNSHNN